ncbi:MAG: lipopolysaccharide biosynthesis protein [Hyphomicrobiales bacterium]|nr:lipopolysaccharide biosynthesis protein [Hyphomicrobiales bacterium]
MALVDQAVVSGASFLSTVVVGRYTSPDQLGMYSIAISLLITSTNIQDSLISQPFTIRLNRPLGTQAEHGGSSLAHSALLSAATFVALALAVLILLAGDADRQILAITSALACVVPFALLREFGRRFAFAHMQFAQALMLDAGVAGIQLAILGWLGWTGRMSAAAACIGLGAARALFGIPWLFMARQNFSIRLDQLWAAMNQSWGLGKWLFASQLTVSIQAYATYWLLALVVGTTATGIYSACMSIVLFANPMLLGFGNILTPKAVKILKEQSGAGLCRYAVRSSFLLGAGMALFCGVVAFAGEDILHFLYHGKEYEGQGATIMVLAFALMITALGMPASNALACMERADAIVWAGLFAAIVNVALALCLMVKWGIHGAAYGFLAGSVIGSAGRWIALLRLAPSYDSATEASLTGPDNETSMMVCVLQRVFRDTDAEDWVFERLDQGEQASVYLVRSRNGKPIWRTHRSLAVKLYKPAMAPNFGAVRAQFEAMSRIHAALHGNKISGWKISTPAPVYLSEWPLAIVMTAVPGRKLNLCLEAASDVTPEVLESAPRAVVAAMRQYWWINSHIHGDLDFNNILCDISARRLSLVDPGVPEEQPFPENITTHWYPASHDLAYMLYCTGVTVKENVGRPRALLRKQVFAENALRSFIETIREHGEKRRLLDEVQACAQHHLDGLASPWSVRGVWRALVKKIARRRIGLVLARLRNEMDRMGGVA